MTAPPPNKPSIRDLTGAAIAVLSTPNARDKAALARRVAHQWQQHQPLSPISDQPLPTRPARPPHPELKLPRDVPRRKINAGSKGRIALLHALAHIELNAIDLAFDIIARFGTGDIPRGFCDDWISVGDDEARHFLMLDDRLHEIGATYGDLPAHDGLWQASIDTSHDLLARLAIVPMVLEARGLDVTPPMIGKLLDAGDDVSAGALQIIHDDEINHVAIGRKWFEHLCRQRSLDPIATWQSLVQQHFKGGLKPPFNTDSRAKAGFPAAFYAPLVPQPGEETGT